MWETGKVVATATALLEEYYRKSTVSIPLSIHTLSRDEFCHNPWCPFCSMADTLSLNQLSQTAVQLRYKIVAKHLIVAVP